MSLNEVTIGFLPLTDAALIAAAVHQGFDQDEGVRFRLVRETSWANIRDRLAVGHLDMAHMLAPMPIAAALGLTPYQVEFAAPVMLGLGGNAISVSAALWQEMEAAGAAPDLDPLGSGHALAQVARNRSADRRLTFGVVHPHSGHNLELRYWLAATGLDPDRDVEIVIFPPHLLPDALGKGLVDGYAVGEPWNSVGAEQGARIVTTKSQLWPLSPEKVLGARAVWLEQNPETVDAVVRAVVRAAHWATVPANRADLAALLSDPSLVGVPAPTLLKGLTGNLMIGAGRERQVDEFFVPQPHPATRPSRIHAAWLCAQMTRWTTTGDRLTAMDQAMSTFRDDLYDRAVRELSLNELSIPVPFDPPLIQSFDNPGLDLPAIRAKLRQQSHHPA